MLGTQGSERMASHPSQTHASFSKHSGDRPTQASVISCQWSWDPRHRKEVEKTKWGSGYDGTGNRRKNTSKRSSDSHLRCSSFPKKRVPPMDGHGHGWYDTPVYSFSLSSFWLLGIYQKTFPEFFLWIFPFLSIPKIYFCFISFLEIVCNVLKIMNATQSCFC